MIAVLAIMVLASIVGALAIIRITRADEAPAPTKAFSDDVDSGRYAEYHRSDQFGR